MDDFLVYGTTFDCCLANLSKMLCKCEAVNLVLNWEKCHFMVREGIVFGHLLFKSGIEVYKAKVEVIASWGDVWYKRLCHGSGLGQRKGKKLYAIYYTSRTLDEAQVDYATTEKYLLVVVFTFDKFRSYLVGSYLIVYTDHAAIK